MFGNPNEMAIHLVVFVPIALALGIAARNLIARAVYIVSALIMIGGVIVTQSRGGFLGLLATSMILAWKLGRNRRLKVIILLTISLIIFIIAVPGNYGTRILSIFEPSLDPVGSADHRRDVLIQSIWVTLRNPLGIGIGNFPIVGKGNLETHNAYTQVSSELGWAAFATYLIFLIHPLRKLSLLERVLLGSKDQKWLYSITVGTYASIVGYMVSSFFGPVAYNWHVYYIIAFAVCLRKIVLRNPPVTLTDSVTTKYAKPARGHQRVVDA